MSEENVEIVLKVMDAVNRRDRDAFMACLHPDVEWREESGDPLPGLRGIYRGRAEVRAWFEEAVVELWESFDIEVEEITEASDHRVFIGIRGSARGKASGVETELRSWQVFTFVDGKAASREIFLNRDEALEAAGLRE
ncbi:MAG: nuclear transport factor 2 family protein [Solirubrobacterales bacterium]